MKRIIDDDNRARLVEETLTDGSKVYNVEVLADHGDEMADISCTDKSKAVFLTQWLRDVDNVVGVS